MQRVFAQIGVGDWVKIIMIGVMGLAVFIRSDVRSQQFEAVALENQTEIRAIQLRVVGSEANIQMVSANLDRTAKILDGLLARMRAHEVEDARRETEIRRNTDEVNRLRQGE